VDGYGVSQSHIDHNTILGSDGSSILGPINIWPELQGVSITNNIVVGWGDCYKMYTDRSASIRYNTFWNCEGGFRDFDGFYEVDESNIYVDPQFVDGQFLDFHLRADSPCIDDGDPEYPLDPDSTRADIGAFYYHHEKESVALKPNWPPGQFNILPPYPNPFNSRLNVTCLSPSSAEVDLKLMDFSGRCVRRVSGRGNTGQINKFSIDCAGIPSGNYFLRVDAGESQRTFGVVLVR
jgi:hypothetical protein